MIRQLAKNQAIFKTKDMQWTSRFYIEKSTDKEMTIIVHGLDKLDGGKALYDSKTYDIKFIKHIVTVGIGVSQQYKYVLTKCE